MLRRFIAGPGTDMPLAMVAANGARSFVHTDRQGSTVALSNDAGVVSEGPYTYDAYGNGAAATGFPFKYTGRRLDPETGLYYYRARYYSSALGRFLQTDPIGYKDQMNLYAYVGNDPMNAVDPKGERCVAVGPIAGCAVATGKNTYRYYLTTRAKAENPINTRPVPGPINEKDKPGEGDGNFGARRGTGNRTHEGTDYVGQVGVPVVAMGDGVVIRADSLSESYGTQVVIAHGGTEADYFSQYAHLDSTSVKVGDLVKAGEVIGEMGRSGNTPDQGDTHVHVEVRNGPSPSDTVEDPERVRRSQNEDP